MWPFKKKIKPEEAAQGLKSILDTLNRPNSKRNVADALKYEKETGDFIGKGVQAQTQSIPVIDEKQAVYILSHIAPDFIKEVGGKKIVGFYSLLAEYAKHLISLLRANKTINFSGIFEAIEVIIKNGKLEIRNAIVTGLLEDIQNIAGNNSLDPKQFEKYLFPESKKWWDEINRFWKDLETYHNK